MWGRQHLGRRTFLTSILHQIVCSCTNPWGSREDLLSYLNTSGQLCIRKTNVPVHPFQETSWSPGAWDLIKLLASCCTELSGACGGKPVVACSAKGRGERVQPELYTKGSSSTLPNLLAQSPVIQKFSDFLKKLYENFLFQRDYISHRCSEHSAFLFRSLFAILLSVFTLWWFCILFRIFILFLICLKMPVLCL